MPENKNNWSQAVQCFRSFFNGGLVVPAVDDVQIYIVGVQTLEVGICRVQDVLARQALGVGSIFHGEIDFGGDDYLITQCMILQHPIQKLLAGTPEYTSAVSKKLISNSNARRITARGILIQHPIVNLGTVFVKTHATQANARHIQPRTSQFCIVHVSPEIHLPTQKFENTASKRASE